MSGFEKETGNAKEVISVCGLNWRQNSSENVQKRNMHKQSKENYWFSLLNMQIREVAPVVF